MYPFVSSDTPKKKKKKLKNNWKDESWNYSFESIVIGSWCDPVQVLDCICVCQSVIGMFWVIWAWARANCAESGCWLDLLRAWGDRGAFRAEGPGDLKEAVELVSNEWQSISPRAMGPTRVEKSVYVHTPIFRVSSCQSNRNDEVKIKGDGGRRGGLSKFSANVLKFQSGTYAGMVTVKNLIYEERIDNENI